MPHLAKSDAPASLPSHSDKDAYGLTFSSHRSEQGGTGLLPIPAANIHPSGITHGDFCLFALLSRMHLQCCVSLRCTAK